MDDRIKESLSALMDGEATEMEVRRLFAQETGNDFSSVWARYHIVRSALPVLDDGGSTFDISQQIADAISQEPSHGMVNSADKAEVKPFPDQTIDSKKTAREGKSLHFSKTDAKVISFTERRKHPRPPVTSIVMKLDVKSPRHYSQRPFLKPVSFLFSTRWTKLAVAASVVFAVILVWQPFPSSVPQRVDPRQLAERLFAQSETQPVLAYNDNLKAGVSPVSSTRVNRLSEYMLRHAENASLRAGQSLLPLARVAGYNARSNL